MPKKMCTGGFKFGEEFSNFKQYQRVINLAREMLLSDKLSYVLSIN
jgi:hypothetical protein